MSKSLEQNLTEGSVFKKLVAFATPMLFAQLLQTLYSAVDMAVVGQFDGSYGISAVTIGSQLMMFLSTVGMGFANGGQIIISQLKGAREEKSLSIVIGSLLTISLIAGVVVGLIGASVHNPMLNFLNTPEESRDGAKWYMIITSLGMVFVFVYNAISAIMRGLGDSQRPLIFIAIATVVNIILDLVFVGVMGFGAPGAALATIIAQGFAALSAVVYLYRRRESFAFDFKLRSFIPQKTWVKELMRMGIPGILQMSAISVSLAYVLSLVNVYGVAASAAVGVGNNVVHIFCMPNQAIGQAASAMAAQNVGAGKYDRVKRTVEITLLINLACCALAAIVVFTAPGFLIRLYSSDDSITEICTLYLRIQLLNILGHSLFNSYNAACMGVGNALLSATAFITDGVVVRLTLAILFTRVFDWGLTGLFFATAVAPVSAALIFGIYYYSGKWRTYKSRALEKT